MESHKQGTREKGGLRRCPTVTTKKAFEFLSRLKAHGTTACDKHKRKKKPFHDVDEITSQLYKIPRTVTVTLLMFLFRSSGRPASRVEGI
jgi:hypothetical protein